MKITTWRKVPFCLLGWGIERWEAAGAALEYEYHRPLWNFFVTQANSVKTNKDIPVGPTHLQYTVPYGFLITWPLCFHAWYQFKQQQVDVNGTKIPGSEKLILVSVGWARWDALNSCYMVPRCYIGLHWD